MYSVLSKKISLFPVPLLNGGCVPLSNADDFFVNIRPGVFSRQALRASLRLLFGLDIER